MNKIRIKELFFFFFVDLRLYIHTCCASCRDQHVLIMVSAELYSTGGGRLLQLPRRGKDNNSDGADFFEFFCTHITNIIGN